MGLGTVLGWIRENMLNLNSGKMEALQFLCPRSWPVACPECGFTSPLKEQVSSLELLLDPVLSLTA